MCERVCVCVCECSVSFHVNSTKFWQFFFFATLRFSWKLLTYRPQWDKFNSVCLTSEGQMVPEIWPLKVSQKIIFFAKSEKVKVKYLRDYCTYRTQSDTILKLSRCPTTFIQRIFSLQGQPKRLTFTLTFDFEKVIWHRNRFLCNFPKNLYICIAKCSKRTFLEKCLF